MSSPDRKNPGDYAKINMEKGRFPENFNIAGKEFVFFHEMPGEEKSVYEWTGEGNEKEIMIVDSQGNIVEHIKDRRYRK